MNIQIFGTKKCNDTKKAQRFFKERGIKSLSLSDKTKTKVKSGDELAAANGGLENMVNPDAKDKDALALFKYTTEEDKLERLLDNQQLIKTPVVRNGQKSTLGYQPEVWKTWE